MAIRRELKKILVYFFAFYVSFSAYAKSTASDPSLIRDLELYQHLIETVHPAAFSFYDQKIWQLEVNKLKKQLETNMTSTRQWLKDVAVLTARLRCAHTRVLPSPSFLQDSLKHHYLIPLMLKYNHQGDYLVAQAHDQIPSSARIISIDGEQMIDIHKNLVSLLSTDGQSNAYAETRLIGRWAFYYSIWYGSKKVVEVKYEDQFGKIKKTSLDSISFARYHRMTEQFKLTSQKPITMHVYPGLKSAYLKISSFLFDQNGFRSEMSRIFTQIKKEGIQNLVLDLRQNEGGDIENMITLISFLIKKERSFLLSGKTKILEIPHTENLIAVNGLRLPDHVHVKSERVKMLQSYLRENFLPEKILNAGYVSEKLPISQMITPSALAYKSKLSLLVSGRSLSSATLFAELLRSYQRALIIGDQPFAGGRSDGHQGNIILRYRLPFSRIMIDIPVISVTYHYERNQVFPDLGRPLKVDHLLPEHLKTSHWEKSGFEFLSQLHTYY